MTVLAWRPVFIYGDGGDLTTFECSLPARPWSRSTPTVGGSRTASSGIPASYVVRRDYVLGLELRLLESEWAAFEEFIAWAQGAETFTYYPDALELDSYSVWLEAPLAGQELAPVRDGAYPRVLTVAVELRQQDAPWDLDFLPVA